MRKSVRLLSVLLILCLLTGACAGGRRAASRTAPSVPSPGSPASHAPAGGEDTDDGNTAAYTVSIEKDDAFTVGVFYYSFADAYISSLRPLLEGALDNRGISYQIFDGTNNQVTQNAQIDACVSGGYDLLIVNLVTSGYADVAEEVIRMADGIPVIFFNRAIEPDGEEGVLLNVYDNICFVGTDAPEAGHLQGQMIGEYLLARYDETDLNRDGVISYAMFKGEEANVEAIYRTRYSVEDADELLRDAGYPALSYFDPANENRYQVDLQGSWSEQAAFDYMSANLASFNEENGNMIELVICNNDDMAKGAVHALQVAGYNTGSSKDPVIPVFGVDATESAQSMIEQGTMTGTVRQDAAGMALCVADVTVNLIDGMTMKEAIATVAARNPSYTVAAGIPVKLFIAYAPYTGQ